jgi:hypothetical protein
MEWKGKMGFRTRIKDMTDDHVVNTIKFLERKPEFKSDWELSKEYKALVYERHYRGLEKKVVMPEPLITEESETGQHAMITFGSQYICVKCFVTTDELGQLFSGKCGGEENADESGVHREVQSKDGISTDGGQSELRRGPQDDPLVMRDSLRDQAGDHPVLAGLSS